MSARPWIVATLLAGVACGGAAEGNFPSEDWSGWYQTTMTGSSTDCVGTELPPPMTGFTMTLEQRPNNTANIRMGTFIGLEGTFEGDSLHASTTFDIPVDLPSDLRARATEADSLDTIAYAFDALFEDGAYAATYEVRTPDLNALVRGEGAGRCSYVYELEGVEVEDLPTTAPEGPTGGGAAAPGPTEGRGTAPPAGG